MRLNKVETGHTSRHVVRNAAHGYSAINAHVYSETTVVLRNVNTANTKCLTALCESLGLTFKRLSRWQFSVSGEGVLDMLEGMGIAHTFKRARLVEADANSVNLHRQVAMSWARTRETSEGTVSRGGGVALTTADGTRNVNWYEWKRLPVGCYSTIADRRTRLGDGRLAINDRTMPPPRWGKGHNYLRELRVNAIRAHLRHFAVSTVQREYPERFEGPIFQVSTEYVDTRFTPSDDAFTGLACELINNLPFTCVTNELMTGRDWQRECAAGGEQFTESMSELRRHYTVYDAYRQHAQVMRDKCGVIRELLADYASSGLRHNHRHGDFDYYREIVMHEAFVSDLRAKLSLFTFLANKRSDRAKLAYLTFKRIVTKMHADLTVNPVKTQVQVDSENRANRVKNDTNFARLQSEQGKIRVNRSRLRKALALLPVSAETQRVHDAGRDLLGGDSVRAMQECARHAAKLTAECFAVSAKTNSEPGEVGPVYEMILSEGTKI